MADVSDYTPEILEKTIEYYNKDHATIPSIAGLAIYLGKARKTIHNWLNDEDKKEFLHIVEKILALQEEKLVNNGLNGNFNASITKLILTKHGYSDKQETDLTSKGEKIYLGVDPDLAQKYATDTKPETNSN